MLHVVRCAIWAGLKPSRGSFEELWRVLGVPWSHIGHCLGNFGATLRGLGSLWVKLGAKGSGFGV